MPTVTILPGLVQQIDIPEAGVGPQGEKGDKGDQGDQGPQGVQGIQGPRGESGVDSGLGQRVTDNSNGVTRVNHRVDEVVGTAATNLESIRTLQASDTDQSAKISTLRNEASTLGTKAASLQEAVRQLNQRTDDLATDDSAISGRITTVQASLTALMSDITANQKRLEDELNAVKRESDANNSRLSDVFQLVRDTNDVDNSLKAFYTKSLHNGSGLIVNLSDPSRNLITISTIANPGVRLTVDDLIGLGIAERTTLFIKGSNPVNGKKLTVTGVVAGSNGVDGLVTLRPSSYRPVNDDPIYIVQ